LRVLTVRGLPEIISSLLRKILAGITEARQLKAISKVC
jgi:hypothetical protein